MATLESQNQPLFFLAAKTAQELHMLMIANNRRFNRRFHYLPPTFAKGKWYTWFEIPEADRAKEEMNGSNTEES